MLYRYLLRKYIENFVRTLFSSPCLFFFVFLSEAVQLLDFSSAIRSMFGDCCPGDAGRRAGRNPENFAFNSSRLMLRGMELLKFQKKWKSISQGFHVSPLNDFANCSSFSNTCEKNVFLGSKYFKLANQFQLKFKIQLKLWSSQISQVIIHLYLLPPATKLGQGYVFTCVCDSVHN